MPAERPMTASTRSRAPNRLPRCAVAPIWPPAPTRRPFRPDRPVLQEPPQVVGQLLRRGVATDGSLDSAFSTIVSSSRGIDVLSCRSGRGSAKAICRSNSCGRPLEDRLQRHSS